MTALEGALRRERAVIAAGLATLAVLAWVYVYQGAGMGMSALDMTDFALFPHLHPDVAGSMDAPWAIVVAMWWVMMVAMMVPSASPLVLLYARVLHVRSAQDPGAAYVPATLVVAGYLSVWLLFSVIAAAVQRALEPAGLISEMMLWSKSAGLSAAVLCAAGLYQFSPLKHACLRQCRAPASFLTQYWRPGTRGAFLLGMRHGAYCVGCCWVLMALLFVGGVMNLAWIAALSLLVLVERLAPAGRLIGNATGWVLIAWGVATLGV